MPSSNYNIDINTGGGGTVSNTTVVADTTPSSTNVDLGYGTLSGLTFTCRTNDYYSMEYLRRWALGYINENGTVEIIQDVKPYRSYTFESGHTATVTTDTDASGTTWNNISVAVTSLDVSKITKTANVDIYLILLDSDDDVTNTYYLFQVTVKNPLPYSLTVYTSKVKFIPGETIDFETDVISSVYCTYQYQVDTTRFKSERVYTYTLSCSTLTDEQTLTRSQRGSHTITVSYVENGVTKTSTVSINVVSYNSVTCYLAQYYDYGDVLSGQMLDFSMNDGSTESLSVSDLTITGFDSSTAGTKTVTMSGELSTGETFSLQYTTIIDSLQSITLSGNQKTVFDEADNFESTGLSVTATYLNKTVSASGFTVTCPSNWKAVSNLGQTQTVTVTYSDGHTSKSATYEIMVNGYNVLEVTKYPSRALKGSTPALSAYTVVKKSTTNNTVDVTNDQSLVYEYSNGTATFTYNSLSDEVSMTVYELDSISITKEPNKTAFFTSETFSYAGLQVTAKYTDDVEAIITPTVELDDETSWTTPGEGKVVNVSYTEGDVTAVTTYEVSTTDATPTSIDEVGTPDDWHFDVGDTFNITGVWANAIFEDGTTARIEITSTSLDNHTFTQSEGAGTKTVTLYFANDLSATATFTLRVYSELTITAVTPTSYHTGDKFKIDTITGTVKKPDGTTLALTKDDVSFTDTTFTSSDVSASKSIALTAYGLSANATVSVKELNRISVNIGTDASTTFDKGDECNYEDWTAKAIYSDGTNEEEISKTISDFNPKFSSGAWNSLRADTNATTCSVSFEYTDNSVKKTTSVTLSVREVTSVLLVDSDGDEVDTLTFDKGATFSLASYSLKINYNQGSYSLLALTTIPEGISVTPAVGATIKNRYATAKIQYLRNDYVGIEDTFTIEMNYAGLSWNFVDWKTGKTFYKTKALSLTGLTITKSLYTTPSQTATSSSTIALSDSKLTWNGLKDGDILATSTGISVSYTDDTFGNIGTLTGSITLTDIVATALIASGSPKISYVETNSIDLSDLELKLQYNDGTYGSNLSVSDSNLSYYLDDTKIEFPYVLSLSDNGKSFKVYYSGITTAATIGTLTVVAETLQSIAVTSGSQHLVAFKAGDTFNYNNLTITTTTNNGTHLVTSGYTVTCTGLTSGKFTAAGTYTATVSYTNGGVTATTTYSVSVTNPAISSISLDTSKISLAVKTNESYNIALLKVTVTYDNTISTNVEEATTSGTGTVYTTDVDTVLSISAGKVTASRGTYTVTVTVTNKYSNATSTATFNVDVTPSADILDFQIYFSGSDYSSYALGETFNARNLHAKVMYVGDTSWTEVDGFYTSPAIGTTLKTVGEQKITVYYSSGSSKKETEYSIFVKRSFENDEAQDMKLQVAFNVSTVVHTHSDGRTITYTCGYSEGLLPLYDESLIQVASSPTSSYYGKNIYTGYTQSDDCKGFIKLGSTDIDGVTNETAQLVLFDDYINPIDGDGNIIVKYPHYSEGATDKISKCKFGIIYNNRLFVSGNPDYPNYDWHSSEVNSAQIDDTEETLADGFVYFSDLDYCAYGSSETAVVGYDIYRDGDLIVAKEGSNNQATLYYREAKLTSAIDYSGTSLDDYAEESYPCFDINAYGGIGAISLANFVGSTIALTTEGLKVISSKDTTYNNAKYTSDVSSYINPMIKSEELEDAFMFPFRERLYLKTSRGVYVGEYKLRNENEEYEWFFLDGIEATNFFNIDNELYFSDDDGKLNLFASDEESVKDSERYYIGVGGTGLRSTVYYNESGEKVWLTDGDGFDVDVDVNAIIVSNTYADLIVEGRQFHMITTYTGQGDSTVDVSSCLHAALGTFISKTLWDKLSNSAKLGYTGYFSGNTLTLSPMKNDGTIDLDKFNTLCDVFYGGREIYFDNISGSTSLTDIAIDNAYTLKATTTRGAYEIYNVSEIKLDFNGYNQFRMSFTLNNLETCTIVNVEPYLLGGAKQFQVKVDHDQIADLIYYNNRNDRYSAVVTIPRIPEFYFITKAFALGSYVSRKTIYMWEVANDTNIASNVKIASITNRKQGGFQDIAWRQLYANNQFGFNNFQWDNIDFTSGKLPHTFTKFKTIPDVTYIRFKFFCDTGDKLVLSRLNIIYTINQYMKGVK